MRKKMYLLVFLKKLAVLKKSLKEHEAHRVRTVFMLGEK